MSRVAPDGPKHIWVRRLERPPHARILTMELSFKTSRLAVISGAAVLGCLGAFPAEIAHAQPYDGRGASRLMIRAPDPPPPPAGTRWVTVGVGVTGASSWLVGDPSQLDEIAQVTRTVDSLAGVEEPRDRFMDSSARSESARFSLGVHHRFKSIDLGGMMTHQAAQPVTLNGVDRQLPGYLQVAVNLKWRFLERHWGAFYGGLGLGGAVARPSHGYRASLAFQFEGSPDLAATDERFLAGAASSTLGVMVYHGTDLGFFVEFVATALATQVRVADHDALVSGSNECIQAGVTWSL
jgi:hypothetical protein